MTGLTSLTLWRAGDVSVTVQHSANKDKSTSLGGIPSYLVNSCSCFLFNWKIAVFSFANRTLVSAYQAVHLIQERHEGWPTAGLRVRTEKMISLMIPASKGTSWDWKQFRILSSYHSWQLLRRDSRKVSFLSLSMIEMQNLAAVSAIFWLSTTLVKICLTSSIRDRPDSLIRWCHLCQSLFMHFQIDEYRNACIFHHIDYGHWNEWLRS